MNRVQLTAVALVAGLVGAVVPGTAVPSTAVPGTAQATTPTNVVSLGQSTSYRIAGADRFDTAVQISQEWYPSDKSPRPDAVYLASGMTYPDALAAAPVAALTGSPLLLTPPDALPGSVLDEIHRLGARDVVVVGGVGAVSEAVVVQLADAGKRVNRIGGTDRYDTSRKVVEHGIAVGAFGPNTKNVFIATGRDFPDALAAGALAGLATVAGPVILEDGLSGAISPAGAGLLASFPGAKVCVAGGAGVVSRALYASIPVAATAKQRLAGADRYATSQAVVSAFQTTQTPSTLGVLATGMNFPDALAGAAWAGAVGATLWVVPPACVPTAAARRASNLDLDTFALLGGT